MSFIIQCCSLLNCCSLFNSMLFIIECCSMLVVSTMLFRVVETGENNIDRSKLVRYCYHCCSTLLTSCNSLFMVQQCCNNIVLMTEQPCSPGGRQITLFTGCSTTLFTGCRIQHCSRLLTTCNVGANS